MRPPPGPAALALDRLRRGGAFERLPLTDSVAAVSVGVVRGRLLVDLCYEEDSGAEVDMNVVQTGAGRFVEVQGTAEGKTFTSRELDRMLAAASTAIRTLGAFQRETLRAVGVETRKRR